MLTVMNREHPSVKMSRVSLVCSYFDVKLLKATLGLIEPPLLRISSKCYRSVERFITDIQYVWPSSVVFLWALLTWDLFRITGLLEGKHFRISLVSATFIITVVKFIMQRRKFLFGF